MKINLLSASVVILTLVMCVGSATRAVQSVTSGHTGEVTDGHARFTVITPTLIRLEFSRNGKFINRPSYFAWHRHVKPPQFQVKKQAGKLLIKTSRMTLLWRGGNQGFTPHNLSIRFRDGKNHWGLWNPGDKQTGNLGGTLGNLQGCDGSEPIPNGVLSRAGWYLFRDTTPLLTGGAHPWIQPRPAVKTTEYFFGDGKFSGVGQAMLSHTEIADWYFFGYGTHYRSALRDLTTVSGRIPIPPRYALGAWRSRCYSFTARQFRQLVLEYNAHEIPLDVMVMDKGWHTTPHWGSYNWNRKLIPHPQKLLAWLHQQGLHVTLNLHPQSGVGPWDSQFQAMCHAMDLNASTTKRVPFSPTNQKSMHNYFKLLLNPLEKQGVDFWWLDWIGKNLGWVNALDFWNIGRASTGHRGMSFSRWGGWGDQRYPVGFSGDTFSRWRVLRFEVPFVSTAGNVGADYWSNDIGGFLDIPSAELYTRWIQFGALSPVFRTHNCGMVGDHRVPWYDGKRTLYAARTAYHLRSRLFPYIYSCAYECWQHSLPLARPLYLSYPSVAQAYTHPEEYQFGPSLLVSPIVSRGIGKGWLGATDMWFPPGTWWNILTRESVDRSGDRPVLASAGEIPVFVRGGMPLPMQRLTLRMAEKPANPLVVCVYPGSNGQSTLYEDDGLSPNYLHGAYALTHLRYENLGAGGIRVTVGPTVGKYAGQPLNRKLIIRLPVTTVPTQVLANDKHVPESATSIPGYFYNPVTVTTEIRLPSRSIRKQTVVTATFSGSPAVQTLLPEVLNRIAAVHRALVGAGEMRIGWKFTLDQVLFHLQVLRSAAAQVFAPASAAMVRARLAHIDQKLTGIHSVSLHPSVQSQAVVFALSDMFLRAAIKWRHAAAGVLAHDKHRYYTPFSAIGFEWAFNHTGTYQDGLMLQALLPPAVGDGRLSVAVPGLADRSFTLQNSGQSNFIFLPILPAKEHPLYNFDGVASLHINLRGTPIAARRRIKFSREAMDRWSMVGPFAAGKAPPLGGTRITAATLARSFIGMNGKPVAWLPASAPSVKRALDNHKRWVNVYQLYPDIHAIAWAVSWIKAAAPVTCQLHVRHDDGIALWVNEHRILSDPGPHAMNQPADIVRVQLHPGWNQFVVRTSQILGQWGFAVRLHLPHGAILAQAGHPPKSGG
ncbi:MAG: TIM-barrel domain-containing protein [Phycisphaerae bacterium]